MSLAGLAIIDEGLKAEDLSRVDINLAMGHIGYAIMLKILILVIFILFCKAQKYYYFGDNEYICSV